jgi:DNA-binding cell septation regulator SpoVG
MSAPIAPISRPCVRFEDIRFRTSVHAHTNHIFIGYADATMVVPCALADGSDLKLRMRSIEVKVVRSADGDIGPRIDLKQEKGKDNVYRDVVYPQSAETREELTNALLKDRAVSAVVISVIEDLDRGLLSFAA